MRLNLVFSAAVCLRSVRFRGFSMDKFLAATYCCVKMTILVLSKWQMSNYYLDTCGLLISQLNLLPMFFLCDVICHVLTQPESKRHHVANQTENVSFYCSLKYYMCTCDAVSLLFHCWVCSGTHLWNTHYTHTHNGCSSIVKYWYHWQMVSNNLSDC